MRTLGRNIVLIILLTALAIVWNDRSIDAAVNSYVFHEVEDIPPAKVALVLGTAKYRQGGGINPFYRYRILGAYDLYQSGKVHYILVSGDNGTRHYNEPEMMKKDLIAKGIPATKIFTDYAGFDTYDSMMRAKKIFGLDTLTVVSQGFHVRRAVYIGRRLGMHPYGLAVRGPGGWTGTKVRLREMLARVKAKIDILSHRNPKFLGEKISIK